MKRKHTLLRPSKYQGWIPAHLDDLRKEMLIRGECNAVKAADEAVDRRVRWSSDGCRIRAAARAAAREDFRRQVLAEIEQVEVPLPSHITRIARRSVKGFLTVPPVRPSKVTGFSTRLVSGVVSRLPKPV
jgi:hypothetical protein